MLVYFPQFPPSFSAPRCWPPRSRARLRLLQLAVPVSPSAAPLRYPRSSASAVPRPASAATRLASAPPPPVSAALFRRHPVRPSSSAFTAGPSSFVGLFAGACCLPLQAAVLGVYFPPPLVEEKWSYNLHNEAPDFLCPSCDKSWIGDGKTSFDRCRSTYFQQGVDAFLRFAFQSNSTKEVRCPCSKCENKCYANVHTIRTHIIMNGFLEDYTTWTRHGEVPKSPISAQQVRQINCIDDINGIINDTMGQHEHIASDPTMDTSNECTNDDIEKFQKLIEDASQPLYHGCLKYTKLSCIIRVFEYKCKFNLTNNALSTLFMMLTEFLPEGNTLPKSWYACQKIMSTLGLDYQKIHACRNDCVLFRGKYEKLDACPICGSSRWKRLRKKNRVWRLQRVPVKVLRYFPLTSRLKRLFMSKRLAPLLIGHDTFPKGEDGEMSHPRDSLAWKDFDSKHPTFSSDPRNIRLALASDGFSPFNSMMGSSWSTWPVILICYNFPPWLAMKPSLFMLSLLIEGPKSPGTKIDTYLQPLIDELKTLWLDGVMTYDANKDEMFNMRVALLWTINDFPAYGMLSGWSTKGYKACPHCGVDHGSIYLPHSRKCVYMRHRRFLDANHPWRLDKKNFNGIEERDRAPNQLSGSHILKLWENNNIANPIGDDVGVDKQINSQIPEGWKKKSVFFELPYWSTLLIRHNLDIMHIEKNVSENILSWLLHKDGRSKENINASMDMQKLNIRKPLWPKKRKHNDQFSLPHTSYSMTSKEKEDFLLVLKDLKFPDGFSSNISNKVQIEAKKILGLKSHDHHILMEYLLPLCIRRTISKLVAKVLIEFCHFFKSLCAKKISHKSMEKLESSIPILLCKLEKIFPPAFFDIMVHLTIHLPYEAKVAGAAEYRWMYPIERYLYSLKRFVRNRSRPEGSIAEGYLLQEATIFCQHYLKYVESNLDGNIRYNDGPIGAGLHVTLSYDELHQARRFILFNTAEIEPYIALHRNEVMLQNPYWSEHEIQREQHNHFVKWFSNYVCSLPNDMVVPNVVRCLARGPTLGVRFYKGYYVNGYKFEVETIDNSHVTQNCGISTKGDDENIFYGILVDILELQYETIPPICLFKCRWYDMEDSIGSYVDEFGFTLINTCRTSFDDEPFIYPDQAIQVFYSVDIEENNWSIVCHWIPRDTFDLPIEALYSEHNDVEEIIDEINQGDGGLEDEHDYTWRFSESMPPKKKLKYLSEVVACANQIDTIVIKDHQVTHHSHDLTPSKSVSLESNDQLLLSIAREAKKKAKMEKEVSKENGPNEVSSTRNKVPNPLEIQSERMEFLRNIGDGHQFNHPFHYSTSCTSDSPKLNDQSLYSIARAAKENVVNLKKSHQVLKENGHKSVALGSQVGKGSITSVKNHLAGHKSAASKSQVGKDSTRVVRHNVADHKVAALGSQIVKDSTGVVEHNVAGHKSVALGSQVGKDSAGAVKHNVADHKVVSLGSQVGKDSTEVVEHNVAGHKSVALRSQVGKDFVGDVEHNVACVPKEKVTNFKRNPLVAKGNGHKRVSLGSGKGSIRDGEYYATWTNEACSPTYKVPNPLEIQSKATNFLGTVENGTREICSPTYKVATPEEILSRAMDYFKIIEDGHKKVSLGFVQGSTIDGDHYVTGTNEVRSPTYKVPNPLDIQSKATNFLGAVEKGTREVCPPTYKVATPQEIQIKAMDFLRIIEDDHQVNNLSQYSTPCRVESSGFNAQSLHAISCSAKEKAQIMKKNPQPPTANGTKEVHSPNYKVPNHLEIKSKDLEYLGNFEDGRPLRNGAFEVGQGCTRLVEDHVTDNGFSHLHQVPTTFVEDHITLSGEGGFTNQMPRSPEIQSRGTYFSKNTNDESVRLGVDTERCLSQQQEDIENMSYHTRKRSRRATFEKYTENNDSREMKEKKGRGWTGYKSIKPPLGKTHHDCWTLKNVPVGVEGGILVRFLGLKARESDSFPLHLQWTDLQDKNFLAVWVEVKKLFRFKSHETKFTPNMYCVMRWCEARVQNSVTTYRHNLKKWLSTLTPEQLQFSPESRVSQEQWHHLLIYWSKEETKLVAQQNVTNRANIRPTCTLGSKSMRRKQFELMLEGHEASDCHTYIIAHKNKKGEFPDENTKTKMEEVQAEALRRNVQDSYNPLEFIPVVDHVYGDHHGGYQRGYGHGLTRQLLKEAAMMEMAQQTYQEIEKETAFHAQELANAKRRMAHMMGQDRSSSSHARGSNSNEDGPSSQAEHSNNIWMGSHMQHSHKD